MVGIYKITSPSGKVYIGQSWNIKKRWHCYTGKKNIQKHKKLYCSIQSHGLENHVFEVIHELPEDVSQQIMTEYEQLYMDLYSDCGVILLNAKGAGQTGKHTEETKVIIREKRKNQIFSEESRKKKSESLKKIIHTKEWNKKVSEAQKGKIVSKEIRAKMGKKVIQMDLKGNFIKEWNNTLEASEGLFGYKSGAIAMAANGKIKSSHGFKWKYVGNPVRDIGENIIKYNKI